MHRRSESSGWGKMHWRRRLVVAPLKTSRPWVWGKLSLFDCQQRKANALIFVHMFCFLKALLCFVWEVNELLHLWRKDLDNESCSSSSSSAKKCIRVASLLRESKYYCSCQRRIIRISDLPCFRPAWGLPSGRAWGLLATDTPFVVGKK